MKKEEKRKMLEMVEKEYGLGKLFLVFRDGRLCALEFGDPGPGKLAALHHRFGERELRPGPGNPVILDRLDAYFAGDLRAIDPIPVDLWGTSFQQRVWGELRKIPPGRTISYLDLARAIDRPGAVRAVGRANGANPVSIVVPCHRVIASDGSMCGYGGGIERKRWLLGHEAGI